METPVYLGFVMPAQSHSPLTVTLHALNSHRQDCETQCEYDGFGTKVAGQYPDSAHEFEPATSVLTPSKRKGSAGLPLKPPSCSTLIRLARPSGHRSVVPNGCAVTVASDMESPTMSPGFWRNPISRALPAVVTAAWLLLGGVGCDRSGHPTQVPAAYPAAGSGPTTLLVGQSWLGLWQGGKLQRRVTADGWQFNAARLSPDGTTVEVVAYPTSDKTGAGDTPSVFRYTWRTLALLSRQPDPTAGQRQPLPPPVGTDTAFVPSPPTQPGIPNLEAGADLVAIQGATWLTAASATGDGTVLRVRSADGKPIGPMHALASIEWRAALSPDGSTVAVFTRGQAAGQAWRGTAWVAASGQTISAPGLTIDDGSERENGAPRALACLLPHGEGAIFTYVGAPADRYSEFQSFAPGAGSAAKLDTPWVMGCLSLGDATD